ncbi:unnamed protein product [Cylicocyclus nassatus]|uniref:Major facilitator superfamily (MFS) profile domain-containing protein n=1 Tax=Cylicocyclus nassatus TaxID=53992 RepID=A0AA36H839_CYLNA|nr:unnamed protein product [Cylicocyclus nassatus]
MTTLYSEIIGPRLQGTFQGYFQMAGAAGSLVAPVFTSDLYTSYGPKATWALEIMLLCATTILWIIFYGKMVPIKLVDGDDQSKGKRKFSDIDIA